MSSFEQTSLMPVPITPPSLIAIGLNPERQCRL